MDFMFKTNKKPQQSLFTVSIYFGICYSSQLRTCLLNTAGLSKIDKLNLIFNFKNNCAFSHVTLHAVFASTNQK